ncbi:glycoside hydrolase family 3 C-terminal domain-containing protein [Actinomadura sp. 6N118]|uniref:beta-glucosidase n=1 Tax=Actinomadura sp. 6N118 TaxID=3375151 RepID=UPI0037935AE3
MPTCYDSACPEGAKQTAAFHPGVPRLGIPPIQETGGDLGIASPCGLRKCDTSTALPAGLAMGASFDAGLARRVGAVVGTEARATGSVIQLAGGANLIREPRGGRNFEYVGEDPLLTGRLAGAAIAGVQSRGVACTLKHFALNAQETGRTVVCAHLGEGALRESDLLAFQIAIEEGRPGAVMTAYNRVNGTYASENPFLLDHVLKHEWAFPGMVMSDWGGTHSTVEAITAGLDRESGEDLDDEVYFGAPLLDAVRDGRVPVSRVDDAVTRILTVLIKAGFLERTDQATIGPSADGQTTPALAAPGQTTPGQTPPGQIAPRLAAPGQTPPGQTAPGQTAPPLTTPRLTTPGQTAPGQTEPGEISPRQIAPHLASPRQIAPGLTAPGQTPPELTAPGQTAPRLTPPEQTAPRQIAPHLAAPRLTAPGLTAEQRAAHARDARDLAESGIVLLRNEGALPLAPSAGQIALIGGHSDFGVLSGGGSSQVAPEDSMACRRDGLPRVYHASSPLTELRAALPDALVVYQPGGDLESAAHVAGNADVAIIFAESWSTEGRDHPDLTLPGDQDALISAVARTAVCTIVVLETGGPVEMPWLQDVDAVLAAWYPGCQGGQALARVLTGAVSPCGRLPVTFPRDIDQLPRPVMPDPASTTSDPGRPRHGYFQVDYDIEGSDVGYRWYERHGIDPLFPFGFGLTYTDFGYADLEVTNGDGLSAEITVTNTGTVAATDTPQVYVTLPPAAGVRSSRLAGWARVPLEPGGSERVTIHLEPRILAVYDTALPGWRTHAGRYGVDLRTDARTTRLNTSIELEAETAAP